MAHFTLDTFARAELHLVNPSPDLDGVQYLIDDQPSDRLIADQLLLQGANGVGVFVDQVEHGSVELSSAYLQGSGSAITVVGGLYQQSGELTTGRVDYVSGSIQSEGSGVSLSVSGAGKLLVQDNWHDLDQTSNVNFGLTDRGTLTEQGGAVFMSSSSPFVLDNFEGDVSLIGLQFTGGISASATTRNTNLLALGLAGTNADYELPSSPLVTVNNIQNGYYSNGSYHLPSTPSLDVNWIRHMLGQVRSERAAPVMREHQATQPHLKRVQVLGMGNGIHLTPSTAHTGLYYTIESSAGLLSNPTDGCATSIAVGSTDTQWVFTKGDEGDYIISPAGSLDKVLGMSPDESGSYTITTVERSSDYTTHWVVLPVGNGQFTFKNRGSGLMLARGSGSFCPVPSSDQTSDDSWWNIVAH